jgi:hypothetical protein
VNREPLDNLEPNVAQAIVEGKLPREECRSVTAAEPWLRFIQWRIATGRLLDDGLEPLPPAMDLTAIAHVAGIQF